MRPPEALRELSRLWGLQPRYRDGNGLRREACPDAVVAVLRAAGAPVERLADAPTALRERRDALARRLAPPVAVAWNGRLSGLDLTLPRGVAPRRVRWTLLCEDGASRSGAWSMPLARAGLPGILPFGYHRLEVRAGRARAETLVISAPERAWEAPGGAWGVFLPLFSVRSRRHGGPGTYADLAALSEWAADLGAKAVATLPLLPTFLEEPCEPSPYSPISRLFWSELYAVAGPPERARTTGALLDYRREMRLRRRRLAREARTFFAAGGGRLETYRRFRRENPLVADYARFRAAGELHGTDWTKWPERLARGDLRDADVEAGTRRYHLYAQWKAATELAAARARAGDAGALLYLDFPLGVHPWGFDVWRERGLFAAGASGGAPPDAFSAAGQEWGFPPMRPESCRESGHRYLVACVRHHLRQAGRLRIDHAIGLHRLFWIPRGYSPHDGVFVRSPAEELYAILCLESRRAGAAIVGEDLGVVPRQVGTAMRRHGLERLYVFPYEIGLDRKDPVPPPPADSVACLNTHDMYPFAAFWSGWDISDRVRLGLLAPGAARRERRERRRHLEAIGRWLRLEPRPGRKGPGAAAALRACLQFLGRSRARLVLVNLEDLWLEREPPNVPGARRPNWRHRARRCLEELDSLTAVRQALRRLDRSRTRKEEAHD
jgi:4-alpha-glucanotransferase